MSAPDANRLARLLSERPYLLADGATGTNLFDMGLLSGDARSCGTSSMWTASSRCTAP